MEKIKNAYGRQILMTMVKAIQDHKAYLGDVDGLIGDGDHGMNMNKGFSLFEKRLGDRQVSFSQGLEELGEVLMGEIGGSMGPIYGTIFMEMAEAGEGLDELTLPAFTDMLSKGLEGLKSLVDARVGDKTLVDTLEPAVRALKQACQDKKNFTDALNDMKQAAEKGRDSTKEMIARFGRASRLGERSRGVIDAGAASCCILLCAMAEGIEQAGRRENG